MTAIEIVERDEDVKTLRAMVKAATTMAAIDKLANTARELDLWSWVSRHVGTAKARLTGNIANGKGGTERIIYPALYIHPDTRLRYMVSRGRVVGKNLTNLDLEEQGYKFARTIK